MADENYIIDLILRARDETAEAFASALGNQEAFKRLQEENRRASEETARSHEQMVERISSGQKALVDQQKELTRLHDEEAASFKNVREARAKAIDDQVKLEASSQRYAKLLNDVNASEAQRTQGLQRLKTAQDEYARSLAIARDTAIKTYNEEGELIKQVADSESKAHARRIAEGNIELQQAKELDQNYRRAHTQRMAEEREHLQARRERARVDKAAGLEEQRQIQENERAQTAAYGRMRTAAKQLANEKITPQDFDRFRKELSAAREEMVQLGVTGQESARRTRQALDEAGASTTRLQRETLKQLRLEEQMAQITKDRETAQKRLTAETQKYAREIDNLARLQKQREDAGRAGADAAGLRALDSEINRSRAKLMELATTIKAVSQERIVVGVDVDSGAALTDLLNFEAAKTAAGRDIHLNVDVDTAAATAKLAALAAITKTSLGPRNEDIGLWQQYKNAIHDAGNQVSTFDNFLRGLMSLGIGLFLNQIVILAGAAAGAFAALASSAIYAGGALAGAFAAGAAQAIPVLGLLATAAQRVMAVMKAVQQSQLLQQQEFAKTGKTAKQTADATDQIANANENLAAAHRRVADAQKGVTDARQKAIRQLQDLILQEKQAALAAKGAVLSQSEAQDALRRAVSTGDTGSIARARLDVQSAGVNVQQTRLTARRTSQDLATRRAGGIEGSPEVTAAKKALDDARRASDQAERSLDRAHRTALNTGADSLAAAGKLEFMKQQLSGAERQLFEVMNRLVEKWRVQSGKMVEPLINSFTRAAKRIEVLLDDDGLMQSARKLSSRIAGQFDRIFEHFTSGKAIKQFEDFASEAGKNLKPLTDIVLNIGDAFLNIAKAGGPALNELLRYFAKITGQFAEWTGSKKGQNFLKDFFEEGVKQVRAFMRLGGAVGKLILDIIDPKVGGGARTGRNLLNDMTGAINSLDKAARSKEGRQLLQDFFENSRKALEALKPIVIEIAKQFARLFNEDSVGNVSAASKVISGVLLPAFGDFLDLMGRLMKGLGALMDLPFVGTFLRWAVAVGAVASVGGRLITALKPLTEAVKIFDKLLGGLGAKAIDTGKKFLIAKRDMVFDAVKRGATTAFDAMKSGAGKAADALKDLGGRANDFIRTQSIRLWGALQTGARNAIAFGRAMAVNVVRGLGAAAKAGIAFMAANPWILAIAAIIAILVVLEVKFHIFEKAWGWIKKAFSSGISWVKEHWKEFGNYLLFAFPLAKIVQLIITHWDEIKHAFRNGINAVVDFMSKLPGRIKDFAGDAANAVVDAFKDVGERILTGITRGLSNIGNFAKNIANAFIDLWNHLIPDKIKIPGAPDINLPNNPIPHLASGGMLGGRYSDGDRYTVKLSGEEAVLNPTQQALIGRDRILSVLKATGGQFIGHGKGFATGLVPAAARDQRAGNVLSVNVEADYQGQASRFRKFMQELVATARRNCNLVEAQFRDMRVNITNTLGKFKDDASEKFVATEMSAKVHFGRLVRAVGGSMKSLTKAVYEGFKYIAGATNTVLKGFDADTVKFSLEAPPSGGGDGATRAATGGMIGMAGERGGDQIPVMVGRGEAVLNWAHQKMIEPALRAFYGMGLEDIFKSTHAYHAGGPNSLGFAKGGFTGPFGSGSAFTAIANFAQKKFGLTMTAGRTNHGYNTSTGNVSDHSWGGAGDFSNGFNTPQENAFNKFIKSKIPQTVKQLIWQGKDQFRGFPIEDHFDHVHYAVKRELAFDLPRMAKILSRAMRGLSTADLLAGLTGEDGGFTVDHVDMPKIKGKGPLGKLLKKIITKVRAGANALLDSKFAATNTGGSGPDDSAVVEDVGNLSEVNKTYPRHIGGSGTQFSARLVAKIAEWAGMPGVAMAQIAKGESNFMPGVQQPDPGDGMVGYGLWQNTPNAWGGGAAAEFLKKLGGIPALFNPLKNAKMAAFLYHAAGNSLRPWYGTRYLTSPTAHYHGGAIPGLARGGFAGGRNIFRGILRAATGKKPWEPELPPEAARLRGIRVKATYEAPDILPIDYEGTVKEFNLAVGEIRKVIARHDKAAKKLHARVGIINKNLTEITKENGLLDQMGTAIERFGRIIGVNLRERVFRMDKAGNNLVVRDLDPAKEAEQLQRNTRRLMIRQQSILKRVNDALKDTDVELNRVNREISRGERAAKIKPGDRTKEQKAQVKALDDLRTDRTDLIANQRNLRDRALTAREAIAQAMEDLYNQQLEAFTTESTKAVEGQKSSGGNTAAKLERMMREAQAKGRGVDMAGIAGQQIEVMQKQGAELQRRIRIASGRGYTELAQQLQDQFDDLQTSISEAIAAQLQSSIDAVNKRAADAQAAADRTTGFGDLQERIGNSALGGVVTAVLGRNPFTGNAGQMRMQGLQQAQQGMLTQRGELQGLLQQAALQGNLGAVDTLTQQLADLDKTIAENIVSQDELRTQIRQTAIDAITSRQQFVGGVFGGLLGLSQAAGANQGLTGDALTGPQRELLTGQRGTITTAMGGLSQQLAGFGVNVQGLTGQDLVDALKNVPFDQIESTLSPGDKSTFEGLINQIIDLGTQLEGNTQQLKDLNGQIAPQGFSSTAWQWFRNAIFTGMGDVLPQYTVPSFDTGGTVLRTGMARLHQGEYVFNPAIKGGGVPISDGDINIDIHTQGGLTQGDIDYAARRMALERRAARASR